MSGPHFLDVVNAAILGWIDVTGIDVSALDPERTVWAGSALRDRQELRQLQQVLDWDASGVTAYMAIRTKFDQLLRSTSFSAHDLILGRGEVEAAIAPLRDITIRVDGRVWDPTAVIPPNLHRWHVYVMQVRVLE